MQKLLDKILNLPLNQRILLVRQVQISIEQEMINIPEEEKMTVEFDFESKTEEVFHFQNKLNLTPKQINNIAQDIDASSIVYIHKETKEIIDIPEGIRDYDDGEGLWDATFEKVDNNLEDYIVLEKMSSNKSFEIMEGFVESLSDARIISRLTNALERSKPFRNFKNIVHNHEPTRQAWFVYNQAQMEEYVKRELDMMTE